MNPIYDINHIPPTTMDTLKRYIEHGCPPGGFVEAVLNNDLKESYGRADDHNLLAIPAIVAFLFNEAPRRCWGSAERVQLWMKFKEEERKEKKKGEKK